MTKFKIECEKNHFECFMKPNNLCRRAATLLRNFKNVKTLMSSGVIGAQYGSTKAQNRFGVSFLGTDGFDVSEIGRICSFCNGSNDGAEFSVLSFGIPTTFTVSVSFELF